MIGRQQRIRFLSVGAVCFVAGLFLLLLGLLLQKLALKVIGPCFMLSGVTWTCMILLAIKFAKIPQATPEQAPAMEPETDDESGRGRIRLSESGFVDPTLCFCEVPPAAMRPWVEKRYIEHVSTMELLASTHDPHEKEIVSIVAMLDVDEGTLLGVMGGVDKPDQHIIQCREDVRKLLGVA
ncbi:MAG: hypothetical protein HQ523_12645 [Lentisphaerae bacterium]|nr:hypothetical protein [Lentisphaerota bacterium]